VKRILFVDDERPLLEGLRTRLRPLHDKWFMGFTDSGTHALDLMQQQPFDVVVTDMRMPVIDGGKLLQLVSERWPQTIRIVLSGYSEMDPTIRLVPYAHQYLSKPCPPKQLENVIDRCLQLHQLLNEPRLRSIVGSIRNLPSLPAVYAKLQKIIKDDNSTVSDVAKVVSADSALAARVLQIVNSAFFRLARRISSVEQAVTYLGFKAIRNLALAVEVFTRWPGAGGSIVDLDKLQLHVHAVAAGTTALAEKTPYSDDAMLAGLLHDIGYWVLVKECPDELRAAAKHAAEAQIPLYQAETQIIGASHAEIGAYLLGIWGIPYPVVEAVAHHHQPERVNQPDFDVLAALVIAHSLTSIDDAAGFTIQVPPDPKIDPNYLRGFNAPFDWSEAERRIAEATKAQEAAV
jgi:HD-like signal output (HDOD) protein